MDEFVTHQTMTTATVSSSRQLLYWPDAMRKTRFAKVSRPILAVESLGVLIKVNHLQVKPKVINQN